MARPDVAALEVGKFRIRPYTEGDREEFLRLTRTYPKRFAWCDPDGPTCMGAVVAELDGRIIGFGMCEIRPEGFILIDQEVGTKGERFEAIEHLLDVSAVTAWSRGIPLISMPTEPEFARFGERLKGVKGARPDDRTHVLLDVRERLRRDP